MAKRYTRLDFHEPRKRWDHFNQVHFWVVDHVKLGRFRVFDTKREATAWLNGLPRKNGRTPEEMRLELALQEAIRG